MTNPGEFIRLGAWVETDYLGADVKQKQPVVGQITHVGARWVTIRVSTYENQTVKRRHLRPHGRDIIRL